MKLNREHAAALREALPYLWDGCSPMPVSQDQFVCNAIGLAVEYVGLGIWHELRREIGARLCNLGTLEAWLLVQHGIRGTRREYQAHRRAWMLLMIQEGES